MIAAIAALWYSQATIIVTTVAEQREISFDAQVKAAPAADELAEKDVVAGTLIKRQQRGQITINVASTKTVTGTTVGRVTLVNNSRRDQPLVRTTQLGDTAGVIVRTDAAVVVPAGGKVEVAVYPKEAETFTTIAPGKLTIIKLAPDLQDEIYAESKAELTSAPREVSVITETEVNRARQALSDQLATDARRELGLQPTDPLAVTLATTTLVGSKIGDEAAQLTLSGAATITSLDVDRASLESLVKRKITQLTKTDATTHSFDKLAYSFKEDDGMIATIEIRDTVALELLPNDPLLSVDRYLGKSATDVEQELRASPLVSNVVIQLSPYWRKELPQNPNQVKVELKK